MKKTLLPLAFLYAFTLLAQNEDDPCSCRETTSKWYAVAQMVEMLKGNAETEVKPRYETFTTSREWVWEEESEPVLPPQPIVNQRIEIEKIEVEEEEEMKVLTEQEADMDFEVREKTSVRRKKKITRHFRIKPPKRNGKYKGKCPVF